jgi:hypothetical protein
MRTLVVACFTPFAESPHRVLGLRLTAELRAQGLRTDLTLLPFDPEPTRRHEQQLAIRLLDVTSYCERLIGIGLPSTLMRHPDKRIWILDDGPVEDGTACAALLREATKIYTEPGPAESVARRVGVPSGLLRVPGEADGWADVVAALAT